jgi:hypothetical protein
MRGGADRFVVPALGRNVSAARGSTPHVQRRTFFNTSLGAVAAVGTMAIGKSAQAASSTPGCFPASPFSSRFPNPRTDPNLALAVGTWNLIANGRIYKFFVEEVDGARVEARISSGETVNVQWDPHAKRLQFTRRLSDGKGGTTDQDFTGYLMSVNPDDPKLRIAGSFTREAPPKTRYDHPKRLTYGFYMTIDRQ